MFLRRTAAAAAATTMVVAGLLAAAPAASAAGGCAAPGVGKKVASNGVTSYYEDNGCGQMRPGYVGVRPKLPVVTPKPVQKPTPAQTNDPNYRKTHGPDGGSCLCDGVIGTAIWFSSPAPTGSGTVTVGDVTTVAE